jgi:hypothetical protein
MGENQERNYGMKRERVLIHEEAGVMSMERLSRPTRRLF